MTPCGHIDTTFKTPIGTSPYILVYEIAYHFPIELEHIAWCALRTLNFDRSIAEEERKI